MAMSLEKAELLHGRYRIDNLLAEGGMGAVYRAFDTLYDDACAIKAFRLGFTPYEEKAHPDDSDATRSRNRHQPQSTTHARAVTMFKAEARLLARLSHPNLPRVTDYFVAGESYYLVMTLIEGRTLDTILREDQPDGFPVGMVIECILQVMDALDYCHQQGVIHRDVKPDNIILTSSGTVYLVDFGIAKPARDAKTIITTFTSGYSPIEQYGQGGVTDARSDIYALGATMYRLLTGQQPIDASKRVIGESLPTPRDIDHSLPPQVSAVVVKAMAIQPSDRFQDIAAVRSALSGVPAEPAARRTQSGCSMTSILSTITGTVEKMQNWAAHLHRSPIILQPEHGYWPTCIAADFADSVYVGYRNTEGEGYAEVHLSEGESSVIWRDVMTPEVLTLDWAPPQSKPTQVFVLAMDATSGTRHLVRVELETLGADPIWTWDIQSETILSIATDFNSALLGLFLVEGSVLVSRLEKAQWSPIKTLDIPSATDLAVGTDWYHIIHNSGVESFRADCAGASTLWTRPLENPTCICTDNEGFVYVSNAEGRLFALDFETGGNLWFRTLESCRKVAVGSRYLFGLELVPPRWQLSCHRLDILWKLAQLHLIPVWDNGN